MTKISNNVKGVSFLELATLIFSLQNIAVKLIGGDYSALEIVAVRSLVALPCTLLFYRYEGQRWLPTTQQPKLEYIRGVFLFLLYDLYDGVGCFAAGGFRSNSLFGSADDHRIIRSDVR